MPTGYWNDTDDTTRSDVEAEFDFENDAAMDNKVVELPLKEYKKLVSRLKKLESKVSNHLTRPDAVEELTITDTGSNLEISFRDPNQLNINCYEVWKADGGDYRLLTTIYPDDFSSDKEEFKVIDDYSRQGKIEYKVYAIYNGVIAKPAYDKIYINKQVSDPINIEISRKDFFAIHLAYDVIEHPLMSHINIYKDAKANEENLDFADAVLVDKDTDFQGRYTYYIPEGESELKHEFWLESVAKQ